MKSFLPRVSLRNLLLIMTTVAVAIAWWQTRKQIPPLRADVARLRTELGYLTIVEPDTITAIQSQTGDPLTWQWRIYVPPGQEYRIFCASGFLPDQQGPTFNAWNTFVQPLRESGASAESIPTLRDFWFGEVRNAGSVADVGPENLRGETTIQARLVQRTDGWHMQLQPGESTPIHQPNGDWLSEARTRGGTSSDLSMTKQSSFPATQRIVLLHMRRPVITEGPDPGSWSSTTPTGDADSIVVWLEPKPAATSEHDRSAE